MISIVGKTNWSEAFSDWSVWGLIIANVFTLLLAIVFSWNIIEVMLLYWCQSIIIGFFTLLRLLFSPATGKNHAPIPWGISLFMRLFLMIFFTIHYGMFNLGHLIFILAFASGEFGNGFGSDLTAFFMDPLVGLALAAFFVTHAVSFFLHFNEIRNSSSQAEMGRPYTRILVMHASLIFGAFAMGIFGHSIGLLIVFMGIKTAADVGTHIHEHQSKKSRAIS